MRSFAFWQRWLITLGVVISAFGLALAAFNQTPAFDFLFNRQINPAFWGAATVTDQVKVFQQWAYGVLGATIAGWGIFIAFIAYYPYRNKERWSWTCLAAGTIVWYGVDTFISGVFGVWFNVIFNTIVLVAVLLPLIMTRQAFLSE